MEIEKKLLTLPLIKDKYDQSRKHTRDYSGLKAYFANELLIDGEVEET